MGENFINQAEAILSENLSNAQFGVSELAEAMHMSRSSLLRKIKKETELSATQYIRQFRLNKGLEMLKQGSLTVSEISYEVGFGSTSYFIKCFREQYGHPPGEAGKIEPTATSQSVEQPAVVHPSRKPTWPIIVLTSLALIIVLYLVFDRAPLAITDSEKSIAVLPFKNESSDSTNLYFVNGLMESSLTNLQKIEDLRVISRTSVEQYRHTNKAIPEIAKELNVRYLVEGSGQRVGNQVLLNIQLIEAATDKHIWAEEYSREVVDIFALQSEVARKIADAIEAIVTPAELEQIDKKPTENLTAYDYYLQALDPFHTRSPEGLTAAISLFKKAIEHDPEFALAYANIAIAYYFLDMFQAEKQYIDLINNYADKALLYDAKLTESLIAKALYYNLIKEFRLALPHLQKALEYNPNSHAVIQMLGDLYANYLPDRAKYLEYALKGIQIDVSANDSVAKSYAYLQLSYAFFQNGFVPEAISHVDQSIKLFPGNYYAPYARGTMLYARNRDFRQTRELLLKEWKKDTTRLDITQEIAKTFYYQEEYDSAFFYYQKLVSARERYGLDIYVQEEAKIGLVYEKMGLREEASRFFKAYDDFCTRDKSIYKAANLAMKYAHEGKSDLAIEQLKAFAAQDNYQYGVLLYLETDPLLNPLKEHPEFDKVIQSIKDGFWKGQAKLSKSLQEKGLL
ncbi:MAG: helix-turn-helix domain-containing protein [Roseivirga sp.]|nr:helix-turn-helix domain-containing protein [Roseivirga sp.]